MQTEPVPNLPLEPRTPIEIIATGLKLYSSNLVMFLNTVALIVIPAAFIGMFLQMATVPEDTEVRDGQLVFEDTDAVATFVGTAGITTLITLLMAILATAAITKAVADQYLGRPPSITDSLAFARGRWGALLLLGVLEVIFIAIGFIALIIPGIYLIVAFAVGSPVLLLEGRNPRDSLKRSRELVKGRWWPVLGVMFLGAIVGFLLSGVAGLLIQPVLRGVETVPTQILVASVGELIAQILATPLGAAITVVLYFDLRARKEGFGLHELQAATAAATTPGQSLPPGPPQGPDDATPPGAR